ncbi:hypothetical protein ACE3NQ_01700 [Paenibacillus terreus]|uniref:Uncharacterized protein n=1 Tax=Paenibacillus terreus TaxID=1387834 RepID=A0ABV5B1S3_9BACL
MAYVKPSIPTFWKMLENTLCDQLSQSVLLFIRLHEFLQTWEYKGVHLAGLANG